VSWNVEQIPNPAGQAVAAGEIGPYPWPPAADDLFMYAFEGQLHFAYIIPVGDIQDFALHSGPLPREINNPGGGVSLPGAQVPVCPQATNLASSLFVCAFGNQVHFTYLSFNNPYYNIQDCWYDGSGWHVQQINNPGGQGRQLPGEFLACPQATAPTGQVSPFVCVFMDQLHFAYIDIEGNIWDCWYNGAAPNWTLPWSLQQINNKQNNSKAMADGPPAAGDLFVCWFEGPNVSQQHFAYIDNSGNGTIQDCWYDGSGWNVQQINNKQINSNAQTDGPPAAGDLFVCAFRGHLHFAYLYPVPGLGPIPLCTVQDCWYDASSGRWNVQQINDKQHNSNAQTDAPLALGDLFVRAFGDQLHFAYIDPSGNIQDCWYDASSGSWNVQQINDQQIDSNARTVGPPAGGNLFVRAFGDQLHFAYTDQISPADNIWHCWWEPPPPPPNPCQYWVDQLLNLSPGDFETPLEYEHAREYYLGKLHDCMREHGLSIPG
jgi:hypothetical protein